MLSGSALALWFHFCLMDLFLILFDTMESFWPLPCLEAYQLYKAFPKSFSASCPASCEPSECISGPCGAGRRKTIFPGPAGDGGRKDYIQLKIGRRKAASAWSNSGETACFYKSYKRGLLFQSHKRKIGGEENLISAVGIGSWRSPCPMRTKPTCPHNDEIRTTGLLYPLP